MSQRRPGVWELVINLGRDTTGVRRRTFTFHGNKTQAQRRLRELVADFERGIRPAQSIRLSDCLARYLDEQIRPHRSVSTADRYEGIIRRYIVPALGHRDLDKLTPRQIQAWEASLVREGHSPKSIGLMHTVLSGPYRYALRMEEAARNPAAAVQAPSVGKANIFVPPEPAVCELLALAWSSGVRHAMCIHLLGYTRLRPGEALGLSWEHVDLDDGYQLVRQSLRRRTGQKVVSSPKTASGNRQVDLDERTVELLREHRQRVDARREDMGEYWIERDAVFPDQSGDWMHTGNITWNIARLGERVGCLGVTAHTLHHFHDTVLLQSGVNPVVVSQRLGHANVSITLNMYGHVLPSWQRVSADAFAEAMDGTDDQDGSEEVA